MVFTGISNGVGVSSREPHQPLHELGIDAIAVVGLLLLDPVDSTRKHGDRRQVPNRPFVQSVAVRRRHLPWRRKPRQLFLCRESRQLGARRIGLVPSLGLVKCWVQNDGDFCRVVCLSDGVSHDDAARVRPVLDLSFPIGINPFRGRRRHHFARDLGNATSLEPRQQSDERQSSYSNRQVIMGHP